MVLTNPHIEIYHCLSLWFFCAILQSPTSGNRLRGGHLSHQLIIGSSHQVSQQRPAVIDEGMVQGQQDPIQWIKKMRFFQTDRKIGEDKNNQTQENSYNHLHGNNKTIRYINIDKPWKTINWREQKHDKHHPHAASHRLPRNYPPPSTHVSLKHLDFHNLE